MSKLKSILKGWFLAHQSVTGSLIGLFVGFLLGAINVSGPMFLAAPLIAGYVAGFLKGSGTKAGVLTLLLPVTMMIAMPLVFSNFNWTASEMPVVTGVGPINATLAALSNGLIRSTWGVTAGFAALFTALGGILTIIVLILVPIMIGLGLVVSAILGKIGGLIGGFSRNRFFAGLAL